MVLFPIKIVFDSDMFRPNAPIADERTKTTFLQTPSGKRKRTQHAPLGPAEPHFESLGRKNIDAHILPTGRDRNKSCLESVYDEVLCENTKIQNNGTGSSTNWFAREPGAKKNIIFSPLRITSPPPGGSGLAELTQHTAPTWPSYPNPQTGGSPDRATGGKGVAQEKMYGNHPIFLRIDSNRYLFYIIFSLQSIALFEIKTFECFNESIITNSLN